jgi:hypothetical protein
MSIEIETLRTRLQQLRQVGLSLADLLQENADRLEVSGAPPSSEVVLNLRKFHEQYEHVTSLFYVDTDVANAKRHLSLAEMEAELKHRETALYAISVARTVLRIHPRDGQSIPSLEEMYTQSSDIISTLGMNVSSDQLQLFTERRHVWNDLVRMIQDGGALPDAEWTTLNASIEVSLGRTLAVAAARGRLEITATEPVTTPTAVQARESIPAATSTSSYDALPGLDLVSQPAAIEGSIPGFVLGAATLSDPSVSLPSGQREAALPNSAVEAETAPASPIPVVGSANAVHMRSNAIHSAAKPASIPPLVVESSTSVFDDIEPVSLNRKFSPPVTLPATPIKSSHPGLPGLKSPPGSSTLSIFDEDVDDIHRAGPAGVDTITPPQGPRPASKSPSPLAERLLGLARFADATGASASLAAMILNGADADRVDLLPDLILHLIQEGRSGLAYHLSRCLEARAVRQRPFVPSWLIRTWTFGHALVFPKGQLAGLLQDELQSRPNDELREASREWRLALSLLVRAATLRPAIIAPSSRAASLLRDFELREGCIQLYNYCSRIGTYGERIQGVFPGMFKLSSASQPPSDQLSTLRSDITHWKASSSTIPIKLHVTSPLFQKTGWSLRSGTSQRHPEAAFDWMNWQLALQISESLISPVMEDRRNDLVRVKAEIDEITSKLAALELGEGRRQFSQPEIRAYLRQAITFAQRWISLHSGTAGTDVQHYLPQAATELRAEIQNRHEPVLAELRALAADHPSFEVRMAVTCLMQSVQELHNLVNPNLSSDIREADPRHLLHAELLKISDLRLGANWEPDTDCPSLEEEILQYLSQPQPDWMMAFKMQLAQGHHPLAERILSLPHWSNSEREALQSVLDSDRQRQRSDFVRELNHVKALLAESVQLDILKESERTGFETRIDRLGRIASSDHEVSSGVLELGRVRDLLVNRREREANRIRSRLRQLNSPAVNEHDGKPASGSATESPQPRGWVMDFDS